MTKVIFFERVNQKTGKRYFKKIERVVHQDMGGFVFRVDHKAYMAFAEDNMILDDNGNITGYRFDSFDESVLVYRMPVESAQEEERNQDVTEDNEQECAPMTKAQILDKYVNLILPYAHEYTWEQRYSNAEYKVYSFVLLSLEKDKSHDLFKRTTCMEIIRDFESMIAYNLSRAYTVKGEEERAAYREYHQKQMDLIQQVLPDIERYEAQTASEYITVAQAEIEEEIKERRKAGKKLYSVEAYFGDSCAYRDVFFHMLLAQENIQIIHKMLKSSAYDGVTSYYGNKKYVVRFFILDTEIEATEDLLKNNPLVSSYTIERW
jgi:hypothetical protein